MAWQAIQGRTPKEYPYGQFGLLYWRSLQLITDVFFSSSGELSLRRWALCKRRVTSAIQLLSPFYQAAWWTGAYGKICRGNPYRGQPCSRSSLPRYLQPSNPHRAPLCRYNSSQCCPTYCRSDVARAPAQYPTRKGRQTKTSLLSALYLFGVQYWSKSIRS